MASSSNQAALQRMIARYTRYGYRLDSETETSASMVRPKKFSFLPALLWFLVFGVGVFVYIFWYMSRSDDTLYLHTEGSKVRVDGLGWFDSQSQGKRLVIIGVGLLVFVAAVVLVFVVLL